ncbi:MAG: isochorismatase family cysteine hydrolase [Candidatus Paceibacterota bacterium]
MNISSELKTIIEKENAAILIVDMQRDFLDSDGKLAESGQDISMMQATIDPIKELITKARRKGLPIIFTQMIDGLKYRDEVGKYRFSFKEKQEQKICVLEGTAGTELIGILPQDQDTVIVKHNYDSFHETELENLLKEKNIKTLIIVGVKTNACVETTIRTAYHDGYFVIVPEECVASDDVDAHHQSLKKYSKVFWGCGWIG